MSARRGNTIRIFQWVFIRAWGVVCPNATDLSWLETPSGLFTTKQRAMVKVEAKSMVGILFDDIPTSIRTKAKALIDAKNDDYWRDLATQQMQYTQLRLIFRPTYYPKTQAPSKRGTLSLTLPKLFEFEFTTPPKFTTIDGHFLYVREYTFHNVLITDVESLAEADDRLANVTGSMSENFSLPVDPFLILQRTGFDCMSEGGWPPNSIDPETTEFFFDDTCQAEEPQDPSLSGCQQAHCTYPLPNISCVGSLKKNIGLVEVSSHHFFIDRYRRVAFSRSRSPWSSHALLTMEH